MLLVSFLQEVSESVSQVTLSVEQGEAAEVSEHPVRVWFTAIGVLVSRVRNVSWPHSEAIA